MQHQLKSTDQNQSLYSIDYITNLFADRSTTKVHKQSEKEKIKHDQYLPLVKRCVREQIWSTTKFLDDETINKMRVENHPAFSQSVVGLLLERCRMTHIDPAQRLQFWQRYSKTVKEELSKMKTNCTKSIKEDLKNGKYMVKDLVLYNHDLTKFVIFYIALQKESFRGNFTVKNENTDSRGYGPTPHDNMGAVHKLVKAAWNYGDVENIHENVDDDVIYSFYDICVSYSCGRRKWNKYSTTQPLSSFVSPMDEAFAMLTIENNAAKWMDELYLVNVTKKEIRKAWYTEEEGAKKWSTKGMKRYVELIKKIGTYRKDKKDQWEQVEEMVRDREVKIKGIKEGSKTKPEMNNGVVGYGEDENGDSKTMLEFMVAMSNGGDLATML